MLELEKARKAMLEKESAANAKPDEEKTQTKIKLNVKKWPKDHRIQKACEDTLVELICQANLPHSIVEQPKFRKLCEQLNSQFEVHSRHTYKRRIEVTAENIKKKLVSKLNQKGVGDKARCYTSDMWTRCGH